MHSVAILSNSSPISVGAAELNFLSVVRRTFRRSLPIRSSTNCSGKSREQNTFQWQWPFRRIELPQRPIPQKYTSNQATIGSPSISGQEHRKSAQFLV